MRAIEGAVRVLRMRRAVGKGRAEGRGRARAVQGWGQVRLRQVIRRAEARFRLQGNLQSLRPIKCSRRLSLDEFFRQKMGSAAQEPSTDMTQSPQAPGSPVAAVIPPVSENAEPVPPVMANTSAVSESADPAPPVPPSIMPQESEENEAAEAERPVTPEWMARKAKERMKKTVFGTRKRKPKGDPENEDFRKRPRKTYSDEQKKYLMSAYEMGGATSAKIVAASMGMNWGSAQNIVREHTEDKLDCMT